MTINWNEPRFGKNEEAYVIEVLRSGYVSEGPMTKKLEETLAKIIGTKHVIMTTSGTAALQLAIEAVKSISHKDNMSVCIPALTFLATRNAVINAGLKYVVADVNDDYLIRGHFGDVFIPVNLLGRGLPKDFIEGLQDSGIPVICDNAGCLGSNVPVGDIGCYSLQGNKIISCGQGGFCATDSDTYARLIRRAKDFGRKNKDDVDSCGVNYKFNDILAAVALGQLDKLEERKKLLLKQYNRYKDALNYYGKFMPLKDGEIPLWVEFMPNSDRDIMFEKLKNKGIFCRKPWKPLSGSSPINYAKEYSSKFLWLPNGPHLTNEDIDEVIMEIKNNGC